MERKHYAGHGVEVTFDPARCRHFAECVHGLPEVFDTGRRPWVLPDAAAPEKVTEVVRRCPSGALKYTVAGGPPEPVPSPAEVTFLVDGPVLLHGDLVVGGTPETRVALCRCGRSERAPFCDAACERTGWRSRRPDGSEP